jgi:hypothetical protein
MLRDKRRIKAGTPAQRLSGGGAGQAVGGKRYVSRTTVTTWAVSPTSIAFTIGGDAD